MRHKIFSVILLVAALFITSFKLVQSVNAVDDPHFSIVDAKRTYRLMETAGTSYGYNYNVTIKNTGDYAEYLLIIIYYDFLENGTLNSGNSSQTFWNTGEVRSITFGRSWENQADVPMNKWIKLELMPFLPTHQTFQIYFDTVLYLSANSYDVEYPQGVTISGKLMNETSGVGIPDQDLRLYINKSYTTNLRTQSDGKLYVHLASSDLRDTPHLPCLGSWGRSCWVDLHNSSNSY